MTAAVLSSTRNNNLLRDYHCYLAILDREKNDESIAAACWNLRWQFLPHLADPVQQQEMLRKIEELEFHRAVKGGIEQQHVQKALIPVGPRLDSDILFEPMMSKSEIQESKTMDEKQRIPATGTTVHPLVSLEEKKMPPQTKEVVEPSFKPATVTTVAQSNFNLSSSNREKLLGQKKQHTQQQDSYKEVEDRVLAQVTDSVNRMGSMAGQMSNTIRKDIKTLDKQLDRYDENVDGLKSATKAANDLLWSNRFSFFYILMMFFASLVIFFGMIQFIFMTTWIQWLAWWRDFVFGWLAWFTGWIGWIGSLGGSAAARSMKR